MKQLTAWLVVVSIFGGSSPAYAWQDDTSTTVTVRARDEKSTERLWEIVFHDGITTEEYARQLDFFDIHVGAVSNDGRVESISNVSRYKPKKQLGTIENEHRLQIGWKSGTLHAADRRLLRKAGIRSQGKELQHYFSAPLKKQLEQLEFDFAGLAQHEIRRTRFTIRPLDEGEGYQFVVVEQDPPRETEPRSAGSASFTRSKER